jgi:hypothetical protein
MAWALTRALAAMTNVLPGSARQRLPFGWQHGVKLDRLHEDAVLGLDAAGAVITDEIDGR